MRQKGIKVAGKIEVDESAHLKMERMILLDFLDGPKVITRVFKSG
jgi:hypothetical protein